MENITTINLEQKNKLANSAYLPFDWNKDIVCNKIDPLIDRQRRIDYFEIPKHTSKCRDCGQKNLIEIDYVTNYISCPFCTCCQDDFHYGDITMLFCGDGYYCCNCKIIFKLGCLHSTDKTTQFYNTQVITHFNGNKGIPILQNPTQYKFLYNIKWNCLCNIFICCDVIYPCKDIKPPCNYEKIITLVACFKIFANGDFDENIYLQQDILEEATLLPSWQLYLILN